MGNLRTFTILLDNNLASSLKRQTEPLPQKNKTEYPLLGIRTSDAFLRSLTLAHHDSYQLNQLPNLTSNSLKRMRVSEVGNPSLRFIYVMQAAQLQCPSTLLAIQDASSSSYLPCVLMVWQPFSERALLILIWSLPLTASLRLTA